MIWLFTCILRMSLTASVVILAVLLVRGAMRRFPKKYSYLLWLIVGIRLVCPIAMDSNVSIFNLFGDEVTEVAIPEGKNNSEQEDADQKERPSESVDLSGSSYPADNQMESVVKSKSASKQESVIGREAKRNQLLPYAMAVWIVGMVFLLFWNLIAILRLGKRLAKAVRYEGNVYECEGIPSPFVMGLIRPGIYIPFRLGVEEREYILEHEKYHIKRRDHITKLIAFLLTVVYWFHPFVWVSYFLMIRDMEMSCDEYVLQHREEDIRKSYSRSLLGFAINQRGLSAGVLSFGETNTRRRVRNVMNFKKQGKWIGILAIFLVIAVSVICLTNAAGTKETLDEKGEGKVTADKKPVTTANENSVTVAEAQIHGYRLQLVYLSGEEKAEKDTFDMYAGNYELRTYQKNQKCDSLKVKFSEKETLYYPAKGFEFALKDYDGDGSKDDFSLGQGQTEEPALGNYMLYQFYCVDEVGNIKQYKLSSGEENVITLPGHSYSQEFEGKDGEISYQDLKNPKKETVVSLMPTGSSFSHDGKSGYLESLDLNVELPEDDGWIQVPISYEEEEDYSTVSYYDGIANTNVELRLWRGEKDGSYGFAVKAHMIRDWSVKCGSKEVPIHIDRGQIGTGDTKGVALSWEYNDIHCSMLAELPDKANDSSLVKAASYIIERWYASEKK